MSRHIYVLHTPTAYKFGVDVAYDSFASSCRDLGYTVTKTHDIPKEQLDTDVYVCFHLKLDKVFGIKQHYKRGMLIMYNVEPFPRPGVVNIKPMKHFRYLRKIVKSEPYLRDLVVFDFDPYNVDQLRREGYIQAYPCPVGYHRVLERITTPLRPDPAICFLGRRTARRVALWERLTNELDVPCLWVSGARRTRIRDAYVSTPGVHLYIRGSDYLHYPSLRTIGLLVPNRCCIVSELTEKGPIDPVDHYIELDLEDDSNFKILRNVFFNEYARSRISEQAYRFITQHYRMIDHVAEALAAVGVTDHL